MELSVNTINAFELPIDLLQLSVFPRFALLCCAFLLAALYWRHHAVGSTPIPNSVPTLPGSKPLIGHLWLTTANLHRMHDWCLDQSRRMGYQTFGMTLPFMPTAYSVSNAQCLEYILKTNFSNYIKGKVFQQRLGPVLGHGIFTADGQDWYCARKLASNAFSVKSFKQYMDDAFAQKLTLLTDLLYKRADSGQVTDLHECMYWYTLDAFGQIGFGVDVGCLASEGKVPFATAFDTSQQILAQRFLIPGWQILELLNGKRLTLNRCCNIIHTFGYNVIKQRKAQLQAPAGWEADSASDAGDSDLLSLFLKAKGPDGKPFTDKQLSDAVINFIIAGRDTTAQALSWTFYELMCNPDVATKLMAEIKSVLGTTTGAATAKPSYDQIRQLRYARACFLEALRLHPSVPQDFKTAVADDTLPDGSFIPKGSLMVYSPYVVNRMKSYWGADADSFRPERWLEVSTAPSPYSFLSFNAGPRLCLGQRLAEIEGVYVLTGLLARFKFTPAVALSSVSYALGTLLPMKDGLKVTVARRT